MQQNKHNLFSDVDVADIEPLSELIGLNDGASKEYMLLLSVVKTSSFNKSHAVFLSSVNEVLI